MSLLLPLLLAQAAPALPAQPPVPFTAQPWPAPAYQAPAPPAPPPPPQPPAPADPNLTESGLPLGWRGRIGFDFASFLNTDGDDSAVAVELLASLPVTEHLFIDAVAPLNTSWLEGNPTLGLRYSAPTRKRLFVSVGGAVSLPLMAERDVSRVTQASLDNAGTPVTLIYFEHERVARAVPHGYWNAHYYFEDGLPMTLSIGAEGHFLFFLARIRLEPTWIVGLGDDTVAYQGKIRSRGADDEYTFQHALELQVGHRIGGGLRLQGVYMSWWDDYQTAVEPYFALERPESMLRLGLLLPVGDPLGPAFERSWGFRFSAGLRVD